VGLWSETLCAAGGRRRPPAGLSSCSAARAAEHAAAGREGLTGSEDHYAGGAAGRQPAHRRWGLGTCRPGVMQRTTTSGSRLCGTRPSPTLLCGFPALVEHRLRGANWGASSLLSWVRRAAGVCCWRTAARELARSRAWAATRLGASVKLVFTRTPGRAFRSRALDAPASSPRQPDCEQPGCGVFTKAAAAWRRRGQGCAVGESKTRCTGLVEEPSSAHSFAHRAAPVGCGPWTRRAPGAGRRAARQQAAATSTCCGGCGPGTRCAPGTRGYKGSILGGGAAAEQRAAPAGARRRRRPQQGQGMIMPCRTICRRRRLLLLFVGLNGVVIGELVSVKAKRRATGGEKQQAAHWGNAQGPKRRLWERQGGGRRRSLRCRGLLRGSALVNCHRHPAAPLPAARRAAAPFAAAGTRTPPCAPAASPPRGSRLLGRRTQSGTPRTP
jgi:hypothetical protein